MHEQERTQLLAGVGSLCIRRNLLPLSIFLERTIEVLVRLYISAARKSYRFLIIKEVSRFLSLSEELINLPCIKSLLSGSIRVSTLFLITQLGYCEKSVLNNFDWSVM